MTTDDGTFCPACQKHQGLCRRHERAHLPQLAQPFWYQLVGKDLRGNDQRALEAMSPEARVVFERKQRKFAKRRSYPAHGPEALAASLSARLTPEERLDVRREQFMREQETASLLSELMDTPPQAA